MLENNYFDEEFFAAIAKKNSIFDFLDFRVYSNNQNI
jgi:hypothetical protein